MTSQNFLSQEFKQKQSTFACIHTRRQIFRGLLLKCRRDEEGMRLGVLMLSDLNADLWDADSNLIQEPQQSVVIYCVWRQKKTKSFIFFIACVACPVYRQRCISALKSII